METKIIGVKLDNNPPGKAQTQSHKEIILKEAEEGFSYQGFVPTVIGPSGKILEIDLIFQKA